MKVYRFRDIKHNFESMRKYVRKFDDDFGAEVSLMHRSFDNWANDPESKLSDFEDFYADMNRKFTHSDTLDLSTLCKAYLHANKVLIPIKSLEQQK